MVRSAQDITAWLDAYATARFGMPIQDADASLGEIGIDSLEGAELLCALEKWLGCAVPSDFLAAIPDVKSLVAELVELQGSQAERAHPYAEFINPYLAAKLKQLKIDRRFVRGEGSYLVDADGERYLDFMAQYGALPFGHHPKAIWDAITSLRDEAEPNFTQPSLLGSAGQLAKRLIELAPAGMQYVTFANSGTEAVEAALKMARHATGRKGILSTLMGFHGKTFGSLSATGKADYQVHFGLPLPGFAHIPYGDLQALEDAIAAQPEHFAAFIVEPIQGEGGVVTPPPGYLLGAQQICRRHGVLLIVDEVQTGLGRTGHMFACAAEGVEPDIITLAKALSGGLVPIGACLASARVYTEKFAMKHSSTFAGNALAARAGLASLDLLTRDDGQLLAQVRRNGALLRSRLEALQQQYPWLIKEVCGRGLMLGIRFSSERADWYENFLGIAAQERELAQFVASYLLNVELIRVAPTLNRGEVLRIQPPLTATAQQCEQLADGLAHALALVAERHTGRFYRAILERRRPAPAPALALPAPAASAPHADEARFAFILHPLDVDSYADYDASLRGLSPEELEEFATSMDGLLEPVVGSSVAITAPSGARARGDFILVPHTAEQLRKMPQGEAVDAVKKALALATRRGAQVVGLGAYSSIVTGGGALVTGAGPAITSGNSYTAVASMQAIEAALPRAGVCWSTLTVAVVGAAGAIGACMAMLLAEKAPRLVLSGNPAHSPEFGRARLKEVAGRIVAHVAERAAQGVQFHPDSLAHALCSALGRMDTGMEHAVQFLEDTQRLVLSQRVDDIGAAGLVVMSTSFPGKVLDDAVFQRGAIICDISRPRSVQRSIQNTRPDVLVIEGGVVALPQQVAVGPYGLERGTAFACMAETMLLALDRHFHDTSIGSALPIGEVVRQQALSARHGFGIAHLQSFGSKLSDAHWDAYRRQAGLNDTHFSEQVA